jgi:hypothetical protein
MKRMIKIEAQVEDDRDRFGDGPDSTVGFEQRLTSDLAISLTGSRYNLTPIWIDTKIIDVVVEFKVVDCDAG